MNIFSINMLFLDVDWTLWCLTWSMIFITCIKVELLCCGWKVKRVTSNSDQMVLTLQLNFALRLQNYRNGLLTFSRTTCKVSPERGRETWCKVYVRLVRKLVYKTSQIPWHRHKTHICIFPYDLHFQILSLTRNKDKKISLDTDITRE